MKTTTRMLIATPIMLAFTLTACNKPETAAKTSQDVSEARAEGRENVNEALREQRDDAARMAEGSAATGMAGAGSGSMTDGSGVATLQADAETAADNAHKVDMAKAEATHKVAKEKSDALMGDSKTACMKTADAEHEAAEKAADAHRMAMRNGMPHSMPSDQMP
ncbi:MAG: hypothetical protein V4709_14130 [Pseudomonadota bacterium]